MSDLTYRVNCGCDVPLTDGAGRVWTPDTAYAEGGGTVLREADVPIRSTHMSEVLRSERYGVKCYRFPVEPGLYTVRLYAAETFEGSATPDRAFGVAFNDDVISDAFMPYQVGGGFARAALLEAPCQVRDGEIVVRFDGDRSIANAIEIERVDKPAAVRSVAAESFESSAPNSPSGSRTPVKVLFVGNSGTFFWDLPVTIAALVNGVSETHELSTDMMVSGGKTFAWHWAQDVVRARLRDGGFDYVVLQDGTAGLKKPDEMHSFGAQLIEAARNGGAEPLLYAYFGPKAATAAEFENALHLYSSLARTHQVTMIPAAAALHGAMDARPEVNYHNPDRHHSGMHGAYAFAGTFYHVLTGQPAAEHPRPAVLGDQVPIPSEMARFLGGCADAACERFRDESTLRAGPLAR